MILKNKKLQISIILYLIIVGILVFINPNFFYNKDGKVKLFGLGENKTMFPFWLIIFVIAVFSYYIGVIVANT